MRKAKQPCSLRFRRRGKKLTDVRKQKRVRELTRLTALRCSIATLEYRKQQMIDNDSDCSDLLFDLSLQLLPPTPVQSKQLRPLRCNLLMGFFYQNTFFFSPSLWRCRFFSQ